MEKIVFITILLSLNAIAQFKETDYTKSSCFAKYQRVYKEGSEHNEKVRRANVIAGSYGISLSNNTSSDWGDDEKTVMNAALASNVQYVEVKDGEVSIKEPMFKPYLNGFTDLYIKVEKKFPNVEPERVIGIIQDGFLSGDFCDKFLFFPTRKSFSALPRYVKRKLEESMTRKLAVEIDTDERESEKKTSSDETINKKSHSTKVIK